MLSRTSSFDELATWEETLLDPAAVHPFAAMPLVVEDIEDVEDIEPHPNTIDPRQPVQELLDIDMQVSALETRLTELRLRRAQLLGEGALIRRLPPELLAKIFEMGVHECATLLPDLSLVSRQWRSIAVTTPLLWSYISLAPEDDTYGRDTETHARFMRKLTTSLTRSGDCKLCVDLDTRYLESHHELEQVMNALAPHLGRTYFFRASTADWTWMKTIAGGSSLLGPALEQVHLGVDPPDGSDSDDGPLVVLTQPCPRLRYVVLEHAPLLTVRTSMPSLRALHVVRDQRYSSSSRVSLDIGELLDVTSTAQELRTLRLQSSHFLLDACPDFFACEPPRVHFNNLHTLSLHQLDGGSLSLFLDAGVFPKLNRLAVQMDSSSESAAHWLARVAEDASERFPVLKMLDLRAVPLDGSAIYPFVRALHNLPRLTGLALSYPSSGVLGGRLLDILSTSSDGAGWILPRLEAIALQGYRDVSGHEILRLVRARSAGKGVQSIRYVKISDCFALDGEVLSQLSQAVETFRVY
ncbi:hypothetical protein PENSPDRAFT_614195 [Peniophora sp. CONT]|nr:hypothetical protein PENSPDRAFT_614195 [Peniophora sp. CONT]